MNIALVTTLPSVRSGIGDYTRHLLPSLREHATVDLYVEHIGEGDVWPGEDARVVDDLEPGRYDQVLYQIGNERHHGFMTRMIRRIGGTVMQHDWVLFDMAVAAFPALARGGLKGHLLALREGGWEQTRTYFGNWLDRKHQRSTTTPRDSRDDLHGTFLAGWHAPEGDGRWTADHASLRIPDRDVRTVRVHLHADAGRVVRLIESGAPLAAADRGGTCVLEAAPQISDEPVLSIDTDGIAVTGEQRRGGDSRRLGSFVKLIEWEGASGAKTLDLNTPAAAPIQPVTLSRDRFELPLNRSVVRFADAFVVHSDYVKQRVLRERNANTPIGIVHHGSERRWREDDPRALRRRLGLPDDAVNGFLLTSFGGVQPHKRVDKLLEAIAAARQERDDIFCVLAGGMHGEGFDPQSEAQRLGLEGVVYFTGWVTEEEGWDWLHAGDVAVNLRGPTSGGTSGGIFQAFSMGRPVLASDAGEQRELPDACTIKVPLGDGEVETIARTLVALRDDPERVEKLQSAARGFVETECHWSQVAERYVEHMDRFPAARGKKKDVLAMRVDLDRWRGAMQRMYPYTFRQ